MDFIDLKTQQARIRLDWRVGPLHTFGPVRFEGSQFDDTFMQRFVDFETGDTLTQSTLARFSRALVDSNYFGQVQVHPDLEVESADHQVPIRVNLVPNARNLYEFGFSYGTHLGLAIIRRHAEHVGSAILMGVEGPNHTYKLPSTMDTQFAKLALLAKSDPAITEATFQPAGP